MCSFLAQPEVWVALPLLKHTSAALLAKRDTNKTISGLKEDGKYTRVVADLSKPETLKRAVQQSSASPNSMRSAFVALKVAGITYIVLLSSYSVKGAAGDEANLQGIIRAVQSKTKSALEESGIPFTTVRPAYFNTNTLWNVEEIKKGEVEILSPNFMFDYISPDDIGAVCGAILVAERLRTTKPIYLCGPMLMSQKDAHGVLARVLGCKTDVKETNEARFYEKFSYMPKHVLDSLVETMRGGDNGREAYPEELYNKAVANICKYLEREPTSFEDWAEATKDAFV
ncbi:hypothetical protein GQ44DRAFT_750778 [Phaeosphaeriaceae sp. PMI808]|nr:hypothetical protein GQ44DRAFT_750778 [Phaeosphaeriaceae sp. PMI808]